MDNKVIFNNLTKGLKDLVDSYILNPTPELKEVIEHHLQSLGSLASHLGINIETADLKQYEGQINQLLMEISTAIESYPSIKTFVMIDSLSKILRKL